MKLKKIISYVSIGIMALSLMGCSKSGSKVPGDETPQINENNIAGGKKPIGGGVESEGSNDNTNDSKTSMEVKLYFSDDQAENLVIEQRKIENADAKKVLEELIKGPTSQSMYGVIDKSVKVNTVTIKDKVANIDFDNSIIGKVNGSTGETLALYGIANTLILNSQLGIEKVTFSVNKDPMESLGGHIVLDKPVEAKNDLIKK